MGTTSDDAGGSETRSIKAIDTLSAHRITSGQVVIDLQTAVKELVENSLDAGATNIEVRFREHGLESVEVIDNGSGIASADYDVVAMKHYTSKLASFDDLNTVETFGFRGEALASLCALSGAVTITTTTAETAPVGTILVLDRLGKVSDRSGKVARQRGTTVAVTDLFKPLPVRRKEFERNAKREFGKALNLLNAYALVPCACENNGVRLTVSNQLSGRKLVQLRIDGTPTLRASISALWGPKTLESLVELDVTFEVETAKSILRRPNNTTSVAPTTTVTVRGMISKFSLNCGRSASDRQYFFINGRPCSPSKVQKAFNEVYKTFNATQMPFIVADFSLPNGSHDINVSPDKRTIFIHSEDNLVQALKEALETQYSPERSTYTVKPTKTQVQPAPGPSSLRGAQKVAGATELVSSPQNDVSVPDEQPLFYRDEDQGDESSEPRMTSHGDTDTDMGVSHLLIEVDELEPSQSSSDLNASVSRTATAGKTSSVSITPHDTPGDASTRDTPGRVISPTLTQMYQKRAVISATPLTTHGDIRPLHPGPPHSRASSPPIPSLRSPVTHQPISAVVRTTFNNSASRVMQKDTAQLVLSTTGAAWNLRRAADTVDLDPGSPRKRTKISHGDSGQGGPVASQLATKREFRKQMSSYALSGSQLAKRESDAESEDDHSDEESGGAMVCSPAPDVVQHSPTLDDEHLSDEEDELESAERPGSPIGDMDGDAVEILSPPSEDRPPEIVKTSQLDTVKLKFDLSATSASWRRKGDGGTASSLTIAPTGHDGVLPSGTGIDSETGELRAEDVLSRVISKEDFSTMEVLGQFNLGFIIVRRRSIAQPEGSDSHTEAANLDDLFIVDQHASDEKFNFETLQQTTQIDSQALIRPNPLELTASDEVVALENVDILRQNGFEIDVEEDDGLGNSRRRLILVAQPVSKSTVFDLKDLEELLNLLRDAPQGQMVRCSKARAMFAMRACRKSVMVGMPLKHQQMVSIVRHMGTMDQPWNCPHGRPTMRHLSDISQFGRNHLSDKRLDWQAFTQD